MARVKYGKRVPRFLVTLPAFASALLARVRVKFSKKTAQLAEARAAVRPIRHWKDNRVLAHIFLAVLAFGLRSLLELKLRRAGLEITAQEALEQLGRIRVLCSEKQIIKVTGEDETTRKIMEKFAEFELLERAISKA